MRTPSLPFQDINILEKIALSIFDGKITPFIREAIFVASAPLHQELTKLIESQNTNSAPKKSDKVLEAFFKYLVRMSSRSTPFGLFSSCSVGKIDEKTSLIVDAALRRKTQIDTSVLFNFYNELNSRNDIRENTKYYSNNTIYQIGNKYRYIDRQIKPEKTLFSISSVKKYPILEHLLSLSKNGLCFKDSISILEKLDYSAAEAKEFVNDLIDANLLVSELDVMLSMNPGDTNELISSDIIKSFDRSISDGVNYIKQSLNELDSNDYNDIARYERVYRQIAGISNSTQSYDSILQVDLSRKAEKLCLGKEILRELEDVIDFYIENSTFYPKPPMEEFKKAFFERYEYREMPLSLVLDPDIGLGYPLNYGQSDNPQKLIKTLEALIKQNYKNEPTESISDVLKGKLLDTSQRQITLDNIKQKKSDKRHLPDTLYIFFQIIKNEGAKPLLYVKGIGAGGANLLSRFTHLDSDIATLVKEITDKEAEMNSSAIVAEIIHLPPNARVGNILRREHIRSYEIGYFTRTNVKNDFQIPVSDIMLSIKDNELFLRSKKHDKQIIPKLTTAHNFYNDTLPVYKFLCDFQNRSTFGGFELNFGEIKKLSDSLPRVCLGSTILSLATWKVRHEELAELQISKNRDSLIEEWRARRNIPLEVLLSQGDNELLINFSSKISVDLFLSELSKKKILELKEFLFDKNDLLVHSEDGHYLNECIVPFYRMKNEK